MVNATKSIATAASAAAMPITALLTAGPAGPGSPPRPPRPYPMGPDGRMLVPPRPAAGRGLSRFVVTTLRLVLTARRDRLGLPLRAVVLCRPGHRVVVRPPVHHRERRPPVAVRRWRGRAPLEGVGVPRVLPADRAAEHAAEEVVDEYELRRAQHEGGQGDERVDRPRVAEERVGAGVVQPPAVPHEPEEVHREERRVNAEEREEEV